MDYSGVRSASLKASVWMFLVLRMIGRYVAFNIYRIPHGGQQKAGRQPV